MSKASTVNSTQEHLSIAGIQDNLVIANDGSIRAILKVEPVNFELKSETEQNGIIYSYQGFLNSLDFPIQIVIQSKKLDLEHYLLRLEELKKNMNNELLRIQTEDYIEYVRRLISIANIMSKRFYVVVSYGDLAKNSMNTLTGIFRHKTTGPLLNQQEFDQYKTEIANRINVIGSGLSRLGVQVNVLNTQQLIELFYTIYNPELATEERLVNIQDLSSSIVSSLPSEPEESTTPETPETKPDDPSSSPPTNPPLENSQPTPS